MSKSKNSFASLSVCVALYHVFAYLPPTEMKSSAELTPVERLLNVCSLCLSPPMIMQIP